MPCIYHAAMFPTTFVPRGYAIENLSIYYNLLGLIGVILAIFHGTMVVKTPMGSADQLFSQPLKHFSFAPRVGNIIMLLFKELFSQPLEHNPLFQNGRQVPGRVLLLLTPSKQTHRVRKVLCSAQ